MASVGSEQLRQMAMSEIQNQAVSVSRREIHSIVDYFQSILGLVRKAVEHNAVTILPKVLILLLRKKNGAFV